MNRKKVVVLVIAVLYAFTGSVTYGYVYNNYWCNNDAPEYNYNNCRQVVMTQAQISAFIWPLYWLAEIGTKIAPNTYPYRKDEWRVGPSNHQKEENKNVG